MSENAPSGAAAIHKGLALFNLILRDDGQTPLPQLAAGLDLPRSTLYRLAGALEAAGLAGKLGTGRYIASASLVARLSSLSAAGQLARLARPLLRQLARNCAATAHLGIMEDGMVTYLVKESAPSAPPILTRENAQLEAYCSGIGKVLLAWLPQAEQEAYLANGPFVALTAHTITSPGALRSCLDEARANGFARDEGEVSEDIYCLAVPVLRGDGPALAGISLSRTPACRRRQSDEVRLEQLRRCACAIGERAAGESGRFFEKKLRKKPL